MFAKILEYPSDFMRLFYPRLCGGCDVPLAKGEQHLCLHCRLELPFTNFETMKDNPVERIFYGRVPLHFATSLLYFSKGEKVQNILHNIKYNERKELAIFMGKLIGKRLQNNPYLSDVNVIMPVPLHKNKQHLRGYNQSELITEGINEVLNVQLSINNLVRTAFTSTQTNKSRIERWENVEQVFNIKHPNALEDKHILLVDDVLTTGATLEACAETLLSNNRCKVSIVTLAYAAI